MPKAVEGSGFLVSRFLFCGRILSTATIEHIEGNAGQPASAEARPLLHTKYSSNILHLP